VQIGPIRTGTLLSIAVASGLITGIGEAAVFAVKQRWLGQFVRVGPDIGWMAPVADAAAFLVIALALLATSRVWPRIASLPVVVFVFGFTAFFSLLLTYYPLHVIAKVAVAAGLAAQTARLLVRRSGRIGSLSRRSLIAAVGVVGVIVLATRIVSWVAAEPRVASLGVAPAGAPNVLLIVWDTVRAGNLSLHGYDRRTTPHLEQWAASGVVFEHAMSPSPWTLPSHASMFTGRWPSELSANWEQALDDTHPTLAEALTARGYATAGFVANTFYAGYEHGLARGVARYDDYSVSVRELLVSSSLAGSLANSPLLRRLVNYHDNIPRKSASEITAHLLDWLDAHDSRPFFAFLNYFDAHESYLPPSPFREAFGGTAPEWSPNLIQDRRRTLRRDWATRPADAIANEVRLYDGAILYLDDQLNRVLLALQARGVLDNTIVIVTSDHGEQFGEHGLFLHGNSLYRPVLHVPLIVRFPRAVPVNLRVDSPVTLRDLPATVLDLLRVADRAASFPGRSLARYWSGPGGPDQVEAEPVLAQVRKAEWAIPDFVTYPAAKGDMESLIDDVYHYIRNGDGREELYAIGVDPDERDDLGRREDMRPVLERYRARIDGKDRRAPANREP
jgi:arylsulfatase A-like enzyme